MGCNKIEEYNVLAALLAKQLGVGLTVAVINQPELKGFLEDTGIDLAIAPRLASVGAVLRHVHAGAEELALQNLGEEQLLVFSVTSDSTVAGHKIKRLGFQTSSHVAAVVRGDQVVLPRGEETLEVDDQVLVFALTESIDQLERLFT